MNRLPVSLARACALWCAVSLTGVSVFAQEPPPPTPAAPARRPTTSTRSWRRCSPGATSIAGRSTSTSSTRPSRSKSSARAAGRCIARGATSRGTSATACTSAARYGSTASRSATRRASKYETNWIRRERERQERKAKRENEKENEKEKESGEIAITAEGVQISTGGPAVTEPRFVSEAYFMDFKFEPGNYYLAGREQLEGQQVLKVEYYPTKMFGDSDDDRRRNERAAEREECGKAGRRSREPESTGEGEGVRAGHRAADEQDGADYAVDRPARAPDRQVHVRQRLAGLPACGLAGEGRRHPGVDDHGAAVSGRVAAARHQHPCGRHAGQRFVRGVRRAHVQRVPAGRSLDEDAGAEEGADEEMERPDDRGPSVAESRRRV